MLISCVHFIQPFQFLLNVEKFVFTASVMVRKVILQKSIIEGIFCPKWCWYGASADNKCLIISCLLFLINCCFKHSLLALTVVAVAEKHWRGMRFLFFFLYPFTIFMSFCIGAFVHSFVKRDATQGVLCTNVTKRDDGEWWFKNGNLSWRNYWPWQWESLWAMVVCLLSPSRHLPLKGEIHISIIKYIPQYSRCCKTRHGHTTDLNVLP